MNSLQRLQAKWTQSQREPWREANLVGRTRSACDDVAKLLKQSVTLQADGRGGECISALLIGPTGVGKTLVVRSALEQLEADGNQVISITLHGRNCSDDRSSMRQIFSQFQRHLIGRTNVDLMGKVNFRTGTLSEWCERLQCLLEECARSDFMVVITLEDFESFCHSRSKQSLLYNLFDLMHVKEARFVVIGVTNRPDSTELLEKRIKSRFQLRKIVLSPPDSIEEILEVVKSALSIEAPAAGPTKVRGATSTKKDISIHSILEDVLESKELRQTWSFYRDLGYSLRDFCTAAISALLSASSPHDIKPLLLNCMTRMSETSIGEVGVMTSLLGSLTQRDHIVLIGLLKLHQYRKRPKCFMNILKEIGSFEKRGACSQICKHSKRAYWHSFRGLIRQGLIESIDFGGVSAAIAPPPMFTRCRLSVYESYRHLLLSGASGRNQLRSLPIEVIQWACQSKDISEGI